MYLVHLTLVIALQAWVRTWDIPSGAKFVIILLAAFSLLLASYQLFVRYTPIGTMLNGRRVRAQHGSAAAQEPARPSG